MMQAFDLIVVVFCKLWLAGSWQYSVVETAN